VHVIADKLGSYVPACCVAGGDVLFGAIATVLICLKSPPQPADEAELDGSIIRKNATTAKLGRNEGRV